MKRLYKRALAALLVCLALLANCTPFLSVAFAADVSSTLSVSFGDDWASGDNADDLLSLAGLSYFASNGTNMISYNQTGETLVDTYMRYYKQFYEEQIVQAGATSDFYGWIANSITQNALGIRRVAGAVNGAVNILIGEPLAQILNPFLNWFRNKFNPDGTVEVEQTVEVVRDTLSSGINVPLLDGTLISCTSLSDGNLLPFPPSYVAFSNVLLSDPVIRATTNTPVTAYLPSYSMVLTGTSSSNSQLNLYSGNSGSSGVRLAYLSSTSGLFSSNIYLAATVSGVCWGIVRSGQFYYSMLPIGNSEIDYFVMPYSSFYSTSEQFADSGLSVLTMSLSSDGNLSYGPDTSSADNIVQNNQTLSVPVIAPSISGDASLSFETTDSVAELLEKALSSVRAALSDASANTLELPSNDDTLSPEIEILDDDDITWADDSVAEVTPTPTPGAVVTVGPSPAVTHWPVSDPQLAVVGSDGQSTLVDVVQTIKGWTRSLTHVYQMYVNLISALFPFLPDELIVLLNWSLSALIFTGLFKRWWWSHH